MPHISDLQGVCFPPVIHGFQLGPEMEFRTPRQVILTSSARKTLELKKIKQRFIYFFNIYISSCNVPHNKELWTILPSPDQNQPPQSQIYSCLAYPNLTNVTPPNLLFPLDADFLELTPLWDELVLFRRRWGCSAVMMPLW